MTIINEYTISLFSSYRCQQKENTVHVRQQWCHAHQKAGSQEMWALWRGRWAQLNLRYYYRYMYIVLQLILIDIKRVFIKCWPLYWKSPDIKIHCIYILFLQVTQSELAHTNNCCFMKREVVCDIWDILLIIKCCLLFYYFLLFKLYTYE